MGKHDPQPGNYMMIIQKVEVRLEIKNHACSQISWFVSSMSLLSWSSHDEQDMLLSIILSLLGVCWIEYNFI